MRELDDAALELRLRGVLREHLGSLPFDITLEDLERRREIGAVARRRRRRLVTLALAAALAGTSRRARGRWTAAARSVRRTLAIVNARGIGDA